MALSASLCPQVHRAALLPFASVRPFTTMQRHLSWRNETSSFTQSLVLFLPTPARSHSLLHAVPANRPHAYTTNPAVRVLDCT
jgi:hypothetical protein